MSAARPWLAALTLSLGSCSLYQPTMSLTVGLPAPPPHWQETFAELVFVLEFPGSDEAVPVPAGANAVEVRLPKGCSVPVIAEPYLARSDIRLPCAGGVYPLDAGAAETLHLSWRRGPAARLLLYLDRTGLDTQCLNVPRLCAEMDLQGGEDPWNLDLARIAAALFSGQMRVTEIRLQPLVDLDLPAGPGSWFLESPLRLPCAADPDGVVTVAGVAPGFHRLFEAAGTGWLELQVDGQEVLWVRRGPAPDLATVNRLID